MSADTDTDAGLPIRMLHDRVLVRLDGGEGERRSSAGIVIPATASIGRRLSWATAVGVGPNVRSIVVGDRVLFDPDDRSEVELHGRDYVLLRERDVHAVAATAGRARRHRPLPSEARSMTRRSNRSVGGGLSDGGLLGSVWRPVIRTGRCGLDFACRWPGCSGDVTGLGAEPGCRRRLRAGIGCRPVRSAAGGRR